MRIARIYFIIPALILGVQQAVMAQDTSSDSIASVFKQDVFLSEVNPLHPFGIFTISTPFYVGAFTKKENKFSVNYSMGNIWHPQSTIYYPQGLTTEQRQEVNALFITKRPQYFEDNNIPTETKTLSTDGVLQNVNLSFLWQPEKIKGTFIFKLNTYVLSGGGFPLQYPASDRFIEWVHDNTGNEDNFSRRQFPFNEAHIAFTDENGKTIRINKGNTFLGTLDNHYYYPVWMHNGTSSFVTLQAGAHLALPLNKYYQKASGGVSGTFFYRKQFTQRFSFDAGLNGLVSANSLITFKESANIIDRHARLTTKVYLGVNFYKPAKDRTFYTGLLTNYQAPLLKGYIFSSSQDRYQDLGVSYLQPGDVWEGQEVTKSFKLSKLTAASMYFFSVKTYFVFGWKGSSGDFSFNIGEDLLTVNNAPDIQYGFSYVRMLD